MITLHALMLLAALILSIVALVEARGRSWLAWAVLLVALVLTWPMLPVR